MNFQTYQLLIGKTKLDVGVMGGDGFSDYLLSQDFDGWPKQNSHKSIKAAYNFSRIRF